MSKMVVGSGGGKKKGGSRKNLNKRLEKANQAPSAFAGDDGIGLQQDNGTSSDESGEEESYRPVAVGRSRLRSAAAAPESKFSGATVSRASLAESSEGEYDSDMDLSAELQDRVAASLMGEEDDDEVAGSEDDDLASESEAGEDEFGDDLEEDLSSIMAERQEVSTSLGSQQKQQLQEAKDTATLHSAWEKLVASRIASQKALELARRLPVGEDAALMQSVVDAAPGVAAALKAAQEAASGLAGDLLTIRAALAGDQSGGVLEAGMPPATKREISSGEDSESEGEEEDTLEAVWSCLNAGNTSFAGLRDDVIEGWCRRVVLDSVSGGSGSSKLRRTPIEQIHHILESEKDSLVERSQVQRGVGPISFLEPAFSSNSGASTDVRETKNPALFDDSDFYRDILQEVIRSKSADVNNPVEMSRQFLALRKLREENNKRGKKKKVVKNLRSRRIRYDVHSKLVNFMAPHETPESAYLLADRLFGKLFGRAPPTRS